MYSKIRLGKLKSNADKAKTLNADLERVLTVLWDFVTKEGCHAQA